MTAGNGAVERMNTMRVLHAGARQGGQEAVLR